jgi:hypothetical protein
MRDFWYRIGDIFARKTEAGGSLSWDGTNLSLNSVAGGTLDTEDLSDGLAKESEAAHTMSLDLANSVLILKSVDNRELARVSLQQLIQDAVDSGTNGLATESFVKQNYGNHLTLNGKTLRLINGNNVQLGEAITLP